VSPKHVLVQANREWQEFRRDRLSLALAFVLPILTLLLMGYGLRLEMKEVPVRVVDQDETTTSRRISDWLYSSGTFVPATKAANLSAEESIRFDRAKVAIELPPGLSKQLDVGTPSAIHCLVDGSDLNGALAITGIIKSAELSLTDSDFKTSPSTAQVVPVVHTWFNPARKESLYIVPGSFAVILWIYPSLLAAVSASREREQGTIIHTFSSNLTAWEFLLGKALVYFLIGLGEAAIIFSLGWLLFDVKPVESTLLLVVSTIIYVATAVMFGLVPGFRAKSQVVAVQYASTLGFFPTLLLSGFVYPINNIPFPLSVFPFLVPAKYYVDICRDCFVRGTGWPAIDTAFITLSIFAVVLSLVAWAGLQKMQIRSVA